MFLLKFLLAEDYEVSLLRLLDRVTNGTVIEISATGAYICASKRRPIPNSKIAYRYCRTVETWGDLRRPSNSRVPVVEVNRLLPGTRYNACTVCEETS